ncbi:E3 ubiquitin-protein ligase TRIM45-like [Saccoglossus kowalevskii]|uniref:E3 ubiquitin-protein ligase TRIM71-like n=1 Tax=Saccoglossus kowalevskii TaxID=10224 RepID=A0ABM0M275_SACKO|nr:PREDICTED: E3 ubiquitin-protein ligase TRIM71-like [Saccoglossus kowalevskii]
MTSPSGSFVPGFLQCPVCCRLFTSPKRLPCGHSYCRHCLTTSMNKKGIVVNCRECSYQYKSPSDGINGVPDNTLLCDLLHLSEALTTRPRRHICDGVIGCDVCSPEDNVAIRFCTSAGCSLFLCRTCYKQHKKNVSHEMINVENIAKSFQGHSSHDLTRDRFCIKHSGRRLSLFCKTCRVPICEVCKENEHTSEHNIEKTTDISRKRKAELTKFVTKMRQKRPEVDKFRECVRDLNRQLDADRDEAEKDIRDFVGLLIDTIHDKERALLEELESKHRGDKELVAHALGRSDKTLNKLSLCIDLASRVIDEQNEINFMTLEGGVRNTLQELLDEQVLPTFCTSGVCIEFDPNTSFKTLIHVENIGTLANTKLISNIDIPVPERTIFSARQREPSFELDATIGCDGIVEGTFTSPHGLSFTQEGVLVVADKDNARIQMIDQSGGCAASRVHDRLDPVDVTVIDSYKIAVTDSNNNKIRICSYHGELITSFSALNLMEPRGICFHANGNLYVTNSDCIQVFSIQGHVIKTIGGKRNSRPGYFDDPWFMAVNSKGNLLVCDTGNHRIQVLNARGEYLTEFGKSSDVTLKTPRGIAVDRMDNVYVTFDHCVHMFGPDGAYVCRVDKDEDGLKWPVGIAVRHESDVTKIYVSDAMNNCIRIFKNK